MRPASRLAALLLALLSAAVPAQRPDALPSWNEGPAKRAILDFLRRATDEAGPGFIPRPERIAVFDNDGTLWSEKPVAQGVFVLERLKAKVAEDPSLRARPEVKAALEGDLAYFERHGPEAVPQLLALTEQGLTDEQYEAQVRQFLRTAKHPTLHVPYTATVYAPMLELLELLRGSGFQTWIVTGGGADFVRAFSRQVYGVPPEQVIGSSLKKELRTQGGRSVVVRTGELLVLDDKAQKPVNISLRVGQRPALAAGNERSGGDVDMLGYARGRKGTSLQLLIDHDDAEREFSYAEPDGASLAAARAQGFTVVSMKRDWHTVYPAGVRAVGGSGGAEPAR
ncbi:haloacid dehalogenase-like hydrolase [Aggregicoccus sp. 17bor-14]|uniref:HAD family hydrolase n=1 Tax=Myxococcaceae TaxID=31 RepID=UPI00129C6FD7|nr:MULTISPECIES: HAD family hydrolase [Myxococcaceae]MBF5044203.1 haloacid dehalogenase-like hydrolase [Simulacricoccus sp. 17bor-14]MRI89953.1 haloacid dehalogenase-like hydrolase [Aggregicoccus sp. 17bor-14]